MAGRTAACLPICRSRPADQRLLSPQHLFAGECEKNAAYMRGDMSSLGACRAACSDCEMCAKGDRGEPGCVDT